MHADQVLRFEDSYFSTTVDDRERSARSALGGNVQTAGSLGADIPQLAAPNAVPLGGIIAGMRRRKDSDELEIISAAVAVNEAGYRALASAVRPGLLETEAFAIFQQAVTVAGADPVGELGNDFRGGCAGGRPRPVPLVEGDLLPIDAGAVVRNYYSDMCRTFAVSGRRSAVQDQAFDFVSQALLKAESLVRPGIRCADVFDEIAAFLNSRRNSWRFDHHLGHGIGLEPVEPPFINKGSQDVFDEGDVFTLEPGLYGDDLRAGVRLEQDYVIEGGKLRRLSTLSLDI
jgi:Xaa-Pro dipeptidase